MKIIGYSGKEYQIDYSKFSSKDHPTLDSSRDLGSNQPIMTKEDLKRAERFRRKRLNALLNN